MGAIGTLGLDGRIFTAQLVNVGIIMLVLWRWAYRPLLKAMDDRTRKIEQGLQDAAAAAEARQSAEAEGSAAVLESRMRAKEILEEARLAADRDREQTVGKAKEEVKAAVAEAKAQIRTEKVQMLREVEEAAGKVLSLALERVAREKLDTDKDAALIREALKGAADRL